MKNHGFVCGIVVIACFTVSQQDFFPLYIYVILATYIKHFLHFDIFCSHFICFMKFTLLRNIAIKKVRFYCMLCAVYIYLYIDICKYICIKKAYKGM